MLFQEKPNVIAKGELSWLHVLTPVQDALTPACRTPSGEFQIGCGCLSPLSFLYIVADFLTIIKPA